MRTLNSTFIDALALNKLRIAELFTLEIASGVIYRYTSHSKNIVWDAAKNI